MQTRSIIERRKVNNFRFFEKRTGFNRREEDRTLFEKFIYFFSSRKKVIITLVLSLNILSTIDFMLTKIMLETGLGREVNPVMAAMFNHSNFLAFLFKICIVLISSIIMFNFRKYKAINVTLLFCVFAFGIINLYTVRLLAVVLY